jgi:hypothetical protein
MIATDEKPMNTDKTTQILLLQIGFSYPYSSLCLGGNTSPAAHIVNLSPRLFRIRPLMV